MAKINPEFYNILWKNLTDNLIPWFWRNVAVSWNEDAEDPLWLPAYLEAMSAPMQDQTDNLFESVFDVTDVLKHTSQVEVANIAYNDLFDPILRRIFISDDFSEANGFQSMWMENEVATNPFSLYFQNEVNPEPPLTLWTAAAVGQYDFKINVPQGLTFDVDRMRSITDLRKPAGKRYIIVTDTGNTPEVNEVLNNLPDPISAAFQNFLEVFVNAEFANGNWDLIDEFYLCTTQEGFTLPNSLTGWKNGTSGTNFGGVLGANGFTMDGISQYVDTGWNPTAAPTYRINSARLGVFLHTNSVLAADPIASLAGVRTQQNEDMGIAHLPVGDSAIAMNNPGDPALAEIPAQGLVEVTRVDSNNVQRYTDGLHNESVISMSKKIPQDSVFMGSRNNAGTADQFYAGIFTSISMGAGATFDHASHNANLRALLTSLGII